ncbi:D-beta-hydroxybutyrate dehydrogenase, mitochondrial-like [Haliotis rufescens]|uniref:D-beta-hydroxybutyrate dehydrogenase, mitochondrial-like n=1 Tax=Haliotis rufescens TaxID=6454 RepID=UPI00201EE156|nr:D-beta-hydroxybutyrate dehydrogenase, mitochondrial-like [Haliotis rufescens]
MHVLKMDVTKDGEVTEALKYVQDRCRSTGLWAVVNNAGIDGGGPVELCSMKFYKEVCEVNLFGAIRVSKAFLPLVRQAKGEENNSYSVVRLPDPTAEKMLILMTAGMNRSPQSH